MQNHITIITGQQRCGASLLCQILAAAGLRVAGDYPLFEADETVGDPPEGFLKSFIGGAVKVLDPHRVNLPDGLPYRFIYLTRSRTQQVMSQVKFRAVVNNIPEGRGLTAEKFEEWKVRVRLRENDGILALGQLSHTQWGPAPLLAIRFEDLIDRPDETLREIAEYIGLDATDDALLTRMREVIRPRSSACYDGLLELTLMKEEEQRTGPAPKYDPLSCTCHFPGNERPCVYCKSGDYSLPEEKPEPPATPEETKAILDETRTQIQES